MSQVVIEVEVRVRQMPRGGGTAMMGQSQGNNPGFGTGAGPGAMGFAQMKFWNDATVVPGTAGSITKANLLTALQTIASDFAAASGTTLFTTADIAEINAWQTGSP